MALTGMIATDKDALVCDLAETYGIYDMWQLPVETVAVLACGLRDDSRIKKVMSGTPADYNTILIAAAVDRLSKIIWMLSKDGQEGRNQPASIVEIILGSTKKDKPAEGFASKEDFDVARKRLMEGN